MRVTTITVAGTNSWIHSTAASRHRFFGASWLEQLLTKAFCPAWRLSVPPGVLKASEVDLEPVEPVEYPRKVGPLATGTFVGAIENCSPNAENG